MLFGVRNGLLEDPRRPGRAALRRRMAVDGVVRLVARGDAGLPLPGERAAADPAPGEEPRTRATRHRPPAGRTGHARSGGEAADRYAEYFQDVCSLSPVASYESGLVIARGASGRLYFAIFDQPPSPTCRSCRITPCGARSKACRPTARSSGSSPTSPGPAWSTSASTWAAPGGRADPLLHRVRRQRLDPTAADQRLPTLVTSAEYPDGTVPGVPACRSALAHAWRRPADPALRGGRRQPDRTAVLVVAARSTPTAGAGWACSAGAPAGSS